MKALFPFFHVVYHEGHVFRRGWLFRVFSVLLVSYLAWEQLDQGGVIRGWEYWVNIALPSSFPYYNAFLFNLFQSPLVIFLAIDLFLRGKSAETTCVLEARPASNACFFWGKAWVLLGAFIALQVISMVLSMLVHVASSSPFRPRLYLFYLVTLSLPSLFLMAGVVSMLAGLLRNHALVILACLFLFPVIFYLAEDPLQGLFDPWGRHVARFSSTVAGYPGLGIYLLHRSGYLLLGAGLLALSSLLSRRLPNSRREVRGSRLAGWLVSCAGLLLLALFAGEVIGEGRARDRYREVYTRHELSSKPRVVAHSIDFHPLGDRFASTSRLTIENRALRPLPSLLLYLNPGLAVTRVEAGGRAIPSRREHQVITLDYPLAPGESVTVEMDYSGKIDERACYLDVPDEEYYQPLYFPSRAFFTRAYHFGRRHAFVTPSLVLLLPESLWYPASVPPVSLLAGVGREVNFTRYALTVTNPAGRTVISQGTPCVEAGEVSFTHPHDLTGISLAIGDYRRRAVLVDSIEFELYHFSDDDFFLPSLPPATLDARVCRELKEWLDIEARAGLVYPSRRFSLVEAPSSLATYARAGASSAFPCRGAEQPGMFFYPERLSNLAGYQRYNTRAREDSLVRLVNPMMRETRIFYARYSLPSQYKDFVYTLSSARFPALEVVLDRAKVSMSGTPFWDKEEEIVDYFSSRSLLELLADGEISPSRKLRYIEHKQREFSASLAAVVSLEEFNAFREDFLSRVRFREIDLEEFAAAFAGKFGVDTLPGLLSQLYTSKEYTTFRFEDVECNRVPGEERDGYALRFTAWNTGAVDGYVIVKAILDPDKIRRAGESDNDDKGIRSYRVGAGECKRFVFYHASRPFELSVGTSHARNLPQSSDGYHYKITREEYPPVVPGVFPGDTATFHKEGEIIVDNDGEGFHVEGQARTRAFLPELLGKKRAASDDATRKWVLSTSGDALGYPVRSFMMRVSGEGKSHVSWTTRVPRAGYYEIAAHVIPGYYNNSRINGKGAHFDYTVYHGEGKSLVRVNLDGDRDHLPGWRILGSFYLPEGETRVLLSDKGGEPVLLPSVKKGILVSVKRPLLITADAMRWRYQGK
jgi:hypothetical protein